MSTSKRASRGGDGWEKKEDFDPAFITESGESYFSAFVNALNNSKMHSSDVFLVMQNFFRIAENLKIEVPLVTYSKDGKESKNCLNMIKLDDLLIMCKSYSGHLPYYFFENLVNLEDQGKATKAIDILFKNENNLYLIFNESSDGNMLLNPESQLYKSLDNKTKKAISGYMEYTAAHYVPNLFEELASADKADKVFYLDKIEDAFNIIKAYGFDKKILSNKTCPNLLDKIQEQDLLFLCDFYSQKTFPSDFIEKVMQIKDVKKAEAVAEKILLKKGAQISPDNLKGLCKRKYKQDSNLTPVLFGHLMSMDAKSAAPYLDLLLSNKQNLFALSAVNSSGQHYMFSKDSEHYKELSKETKKTISKNLSKVLGEKAYRKNTKTYKDANESLGDTQPSTGSSPTKQGDSAFDEPDEKPPLVRPKQPEKESHMDAIAGKLARRMVFFSSLDKKESRDNARQVISTSIKKHFNENDLKDYRQDTNLRHRLYNKVNSKLDKKTNDNQIDEIVKDIADAKHKAKDIAENAMKEVSYKTHHKDDDKGHLSKSHLKRHEQQKQKMTKKLEFSIEKHFGEELLTMQSGEINTLISDISSKVENSVRFYELEKGRSRPSKMDNDKTVFQQNTLRGNEADKHKASTYKDAIDEIVKDISLQATKRQ